MKKFLLLLFASITIIAAFCFAPKPAIAESNPSVCVWVNAAQLQCRRATDNSFIQSIPGFNINLGNIGAVISDVVKDPKSFDNKIIDAYDKVGGLGVNEDQLFYNPFISNEGTVVFQNNGINGGEFENQRIVCTVGKDGDKSVAGNACVATDYSGKTVRDLVLVGRIENASKSDGGNCSIINPNGPCTIAGQGVPNASVAGKTAGTEITAQEVNGHNLQPFLDGIKNTTLIKASQLAATDCASSFNNPLSFVLCPLSEFVNNILGAAMNLITSLLTLPAITGTNGQEGLVSASNAVKNIANGAFVLVFLIVIFANFVAIPGLDNYTIKKMLPRLIAVIIITQFAFLISSVFVDLGNIIGKTVPDAVVTAYYNAAPEEQGKCTLTDGKTVVNITNVTQAVQCTFNPYQNINAALSGKAPISTILTGGVALFGFGFILATAGLVLALIAVFYLVFRYAALVVLIVIAPIALAAWVLPNTEKFTKWWATSFLKLVLMYPMVMMVIALAAITTSLFGNIDSPVASLISLVVPLIALILIPKCLKFSSSAITGAGKALSNTRKESAGGKLATNAVKKSAKEGGLASVKGKGLEKFGGVVPGKQGIKLQARGAEIANRKAAGKKEMYDKLPETKLLDLAKKGDEVAAKSLDTKRRTLAYEISRDASNGIAPSATQLGRLQSMNTALAGASDPVSNTPYPPVQPNIPPNVTLPPGDWRQVVNQTKSNAPAPTPPPATPSQTGPPGTPTPPQNTPPNTPPRTPPGRNPNPPPPTAPPAPPAPPTGTPPTNPPNFPPVTPP